LLFCFYFIFIFFNTPTPPPPPLIPKREVNEIKLLFFLVTDSGLSATLY
jgi:hypothetical protein